MKEYTLRFALHEILSSLFYHMGIPAWSRFPDINTKDFKIHFVYFIEHPSILKNGKH